jgi:hypothetical protein
MYGSSDQGKSYGDLFTGETFGFLSPKEPRMPGKPAPPFHLFSCCLG